MVEMLGIDLNDIKILSEIFKNIILGIATIIGAFWALYKFNQLNQKKIAFLTEQKILLEKEKIKLENENTEINLRIQPVINIEIKTEIMSSLNNYSIVKTIVKLINSGSDDSFLNLLSPFSVTEIKLENNQFSLGDRENYRLNYLGGNFTRGLVLRKNMVKEFVFINSFSSGIYLLKFEVEINDDEKKKLKDRFKKKFITPKWEKSEIIEIK